MRLLSIIFILSFTSLGLQAQDTSFLNAYDKYWEIDDGYYRVMTDGKIGLVHHNGDIIIPCENDQVWNLQDNGHIKVLKNGKLGIYKTNGDLIIPTIYEMIWDFEDGKARVLRNGKIGYVNVHGNEYIPCKYDQVWAFEDGKYKVLKEGKTGFVNASGNEYIPAIYQKIWEFENGRAKVLRNGKMGYISMQGLELIPCEYQHIGTFGNGIAKVIKNGKVAYIDLNGNPAVNPVTVSEEEQDEDDSWVSDESEFSREVTKTKIRISKEDTTVIKLFGSKIEVVGENGDKEFSFDRYKDGSWHKDKRKKDHRFKGHFWGVDMGLNNYMNAEGDFSLPDEYRNMSLNTGKSIELSVNFFQQNIALGRNVGFVTGLGLTYNNYRFDNPNIPVVEGGVLSSQAIIDPVEKNKLSTLYLTAPLMFELQFSRRRSDAFYLSTGVIGAYRVNSHTKVVTKNDGDRTKDKNKDSFALNDFRYGAHVRLGFKSINLYGTYYLSEMFQSNKGPELYPISLGLAFYPGQW